MSQEQVYEWRWYRCPITGCGALPLRARPHPALPGSWSVGFVESPLWTTPGPAPRCPRCGDELERLAPAETAFLAATDKGLEQREAVRRGIGGLIRRVTGISRPGTRESEASVQARAFTAMRR